MSSAERGQKNGRPRRRWNRHKNRRLDDQTVPQGFVYSTPQQGSNRTSNTNSVSESGGPAHRYFHVQRREDSCQYTGRVQETHQQHSSIQTLAAGSRTATESAKDKSVASVAGPRTDGAVGFANRGQMRNSWRNSRHNVTNRGNGTNRSTTEHYRRGKWKRNELSNGLSRRGKVRKEGKISCVLGHEGQQGQAVVARLPVGGGRGQRSSPAAASTSSTSSSGGGTDGQQAVSEIPGFYYDPDKKKYFRILPGHNNYNPLTTADIQQRQQEEKRQQLLEQDRNRTVPQFKLKGGTRRASNSYGPQLLLKKQLGQLSPGVAQRCAEESFLVEMDKQKLNINLYESFTEDTVNILALQPDSNCERLLALSDARHISSCQLDFISFKTLKTLDSVQDGGSYLQYFTPGKVTGICWASVTGPDSHALFSVLDEGPDSPSCARLMCAEKVMTNDHYIPGPGGAGLMLGRNYEVKSAWTCAWNPNPAFPKCFSVGANNSSVVIDAFTGERDVINTNSDVFAQRFCSTTPVLLSGTRRGEIVGSDLRVRTRSRGTALTLRHGSSVCCLRLLRDENYLLASDMQGKIKLWDLRVLRCMLDYPGHVNQYAHIPIIIDSKENFIFAVGQDCHTRMWDLRAGRLLRTIPSIHPTTHTSRPTIAFSWGWGGEGGAPGLLMGVHDELYWYKRGLSV